MKAIYYVKEEEDKFTLEVIDTIVKEHNKNFLDVKIDIQRGRLKAITATPMIEVVKTLY